MPGNLPGDDLAPELVFYGDETGTEAKRSALCAVDVKRLTGSTLPSVRRDILTLTLTAKRLYTTLGE